MRHKLSLERSRNQMTAINQWAQNKSPYIALASITLVFSVEALFELTKAYREGLIQKTLQNAPPPDEWLSLYINHKRIWHVLRAQIFSFGGQSKEIIQYDDRSVELLKDAKQFKQRELIRSELMSEIENHHFEALPELLEDQIKWFLQESRGENQHEISDDMVLQPEIIFGLAVLLPCWLIYRQYPVTMLRRARQGHIDDIERLLKLDPTALIDKKISAHFHNACFKTNQYNYQRIVKALGSLPKAKLTLSKMKMNIAGLISAQSERLGQRLKEPEIRSLFDAIAKDTGIGDIDTDIPDSPEAFSQAILRERKFWFPVLPDKK